MASVKTRDETESERTRKRRVPLGDRTNASRDHQDNGGCSAPETISRKKKRSNSGPAKAKSAIESKESPKSNSGGKSAIWTSEEDDLLRDAVQVHKARNWKIIAEHLPNRTDVQCLHRWQKVLNPVLVKGYWTAEEDERMIEMVAMFGTKRWAAIARCLPGRNGKQCRERWCNHLDPSISRDEWTEAEDTVLFLTHKKFGNKWADISKFLPGRSDNGIKNRWNTSVKKKAKVLEESWKFVNLHDIQQHDDTDLLYCIEGYLTDSHLKECTHDENCTCFPRLEYTAQIETTVVSQTQRNPRV